MGSVLAYLDSLQNPAPVIKLNRDCNNAENFNQLLLDIQEVSTGNVRVAADFISPLALKHWQLAILLEVLRCKIRADIVANDNTPQAQETLQAAAILTLLLRIIHQKGMSDPFDCRNNRQLNPDVFNLLNNRFDFRIDIGALRNYEIVDHSYQSYLCVLIQTWVSQFNDLRLVAIRLRRLSVMIANCLLAFNDFKQFGQIWKAIHAWLEAHGGLVFFANLGWLFCLPRIIRNLTILSFHFLADPFLNPVEAEMDRTLRFRVHWMRIWEEIVADSYWEVNGVLLRFVFYGLSTPFTALMNLMIQIADFSNAIVKAIIILRRLNQLQAELLGFKMDEALGHHLSERIAYEQKVLFYRIFHFTTLLVAVSLTLPFAFALHPLLPVMGALILVIMTLISWNKRLEFNTELNARFKVASLQAAPAPSLPTPSDAEDENVPVFAP